LHPYILKIGAFQLTSYGLLLALSFLFGIYFSIYRAKKRKINPDIIMDIGVLIIISAIVGSRALYVIFHLDEFSGHWTDTFNPFQSSGQIGIAGLTMLGGVLLSFLTGFIYLKIKKLPFLQFADLVIPSVAFGEFLTRIGCFLNGCCFGKPCYHGPFCVTFPPDSAAGSLFQGVALIPTQLYTSAYALLIFIILLFIERWRTFDGFLLYWFLILYGIGRFVVDFYRYYEDSMIMATIGGVPLSVNQGISLAFIFSGMVLLIFSWFRSKRSA
jgi:phosphatidylglycerol---prolipoprotein diacylglyceryl transferase